MQLQQNLINVISRSSVTYFFVCSCLILCSILSAMEHKHSTIVSMVLSAKGICISFKPFDLQKSSIAATSFFLFSSLMSCKKNIFLPLSHAFIVCRFLSFYCTCIPDPPQLFFAQMPQILPRKLIKNPRKKQRQY